MELSGYINFTELSKPFIWLEHFIKLICDTYGRILYHIYEEVPYSVMGVTHPRPHFKIRWSLLKSAAISLLENAAISHSWDAIVSS